MIELVDFEGRVTKIHILGHCKKGHKLVLWDMKGKGKEDMISCPVCALLKEGA